jgi:hypothetical protein
MDELIITYSDDNGPGEIVIRGERFSFGRGSDVDHRFDDSGLSRLHATIYREGERVWIVDENSSNGTFVNGQRTEPAGTPLRDGDLIRIGNYTNLKLEIRVKPAAAVESPSTTVSSSHAASEESSSMLLPLAIVGVAVLIVGISAILIGVRVMGGGGQSVVTDSGYEDSFPTDPEDNAAGNDAGNDPSSNTNSNGSENSGATLDPADSPTPDLYSTPLPGTGTPGQSLPVGKTYQQMSEAEKNQYVKNKAEVVSRVIGNSGSESIPPEAVLKIRAFLDSYVSRIRSSRVNSCTGSGWLKSDMTSVLTRARANAPFIIHAFNDRGIDPQVGLYLAMIESEHCECLQSYTGPLGMFQFTQATGKRYGLETRSGASPENPDQRCEKEPAAKAAAGYMKALTGRIGTGPLSIPLAIASYNSGEGGLGKNLRTALEANESQDRSFWTLVANSDKLAEQFQRENIKYVPKFFAAAIIGENPRDFGIDMLPLSLYTK